jgi:hypothetical protein
MSKFDRQPSFFNPRSSHSSKKWNSKVYVGTDYLPSSNTSSNPSSNTSSNPFIANSSNKKHVVFETGTGTRAGSSPDFKGTKVEPQFYFTTPLQSTVQSPAQSLSANWFQTTEQRLLEENKKLREELLTIRESFLKDKESLLDRIEKKNDIIHDLRDRVNYYEYNDSY